MISPEIVIKTAEAEVGYLEKSAAVFKINKGIIYEKTAGAGQDNYTKYGKEMHDVYPKTMDFPAAWCDAFVDWCFVKSYGVEIAKNLLCGGFDDYTINSANYYKKAGQWFTKDPAPGDQVFFKNTQKICHTGLVYKVDSKHIYTIEGNTNNKGILVPNGGCVAKKSYLINYANIAGYGRPKYDIPVVCGLGDFGGHVKMLQQRLMAMGYPLPKFGADGDFGNETFVALKEFQVQNGLWTSGMCDEDSWKKILNV